MSAPTNQLEEQIVTILREANGQPLALHDVEERLAAAGIGPLDTFTVRDAAWKLIMDGRADLTPGRYIKLVNA
jgi:hypothetical protein